jgi:hypothetical protein
MIMTEQLERLVKPAEAREFASGAESAPQAAVETPVLITGAEVVFSTAAAVPLRPATTGWRTRAGQVAPAIRRVFAASLAYELPKPRPRPTRLLYLEHSRMAREMERL